MDTPSQENLAKLEYQTILTQAIKSAKRNFKLNNPKMAKLVDCKINAFVYKKRPKGFSKVIPSLVEIMLDDGAGMTQKELTIKVGKLYPEQNISRSIWNKVLQKYEIEGINKTLKDKNVSTNIVKGCKTLSEIRRRLIIHFKIEDGQGREFNIPIVFNKDLAIIGKKLYPIVKRGEHPSIRVNMPDGKRQWLRLDVLGFALRDGE